MGDAWSHVAVLADRRTDVEAALLVPELDAHGVRAVKSGVGGSTGWPEAGGYAQVTVRGDDLERARAVVRAMGMCKLA